MYALGQKWLFSTCNNGILEHSCIEVEYIIMQ